MLSKGSILSYYSNHPILKSLSIRLCVRVLLNHWRGRWVLLCSSRSCGLDNSINLILQDLEELMASSLVVTNYYALVGKVCITKLEGFTYRIYLVSKFANIQIIRS